MIQKIRRLIRKKRTWFAVVLLVPYLLVVTILADEYYSRSWYQWPVFPDRMYDPRLSCHYLVYKERAAVLLAVVHHQNGVHDPASIRQLIDMPASVLPVSGYVDPEVQRQMNDPALVTFRMLNSIRMDIGSDPTLINQLQALAATTDLYDARLFEAALIVEGDNAGQFREVSLEQMDVLADLYSVSRERVEQDWIYQAVRLHGASTDLLEYAQGSPAMLRAYADACSLIPVSQADREALAAAVFASPELEDDTAAAACLLGTDHPRWEAYHQAMMARFTYKTFLGFEYTVMRTGSMMDMRLLGRIQDMASIPPVDAQGMQAIAQQDFAWFEETLWPPRLHVEYKAWLLFRHAPEAAEQWVAWPQYIQKQDQTVTSREVYHRQMDRSLERYRQHDAWGRAQDSPAA